MRERGAWSKGSRQEREERAEKKGQFAEGKIRAKGKRVRKGNSVESGTRKRSRKWERRDAQIYFGRFKSFFRLISKDLEMKISLIGLLVTKVAVEYSSCVMYYLLFATDVIRVALIWPNLFCSFQLCSSFVVLEYLPFGMRALICSSAA